MKVNFALTFLTNMALWWFETKVNQEETAGIYHDWATNWDEFTKELKMNFGITDIQGESTKLLENLKMRSSDKITMYNIEFMHLLSQLHWGDGVLCYCYYKGLPD